MQVGLQLGYQNLHKMPDEEFFRRETQLGIICDFIVCFDDKQKVAEYTDKYFSQLFYQVATHYEFGGEHFKELPSYGTYVAQGEMADAAGGHDKAYRDYIGANLIGTPEEMLEQHRHRTELVGDYEIIANFSFGGMPYELVYDQMKRFADKIMPTLKG